MNPVAIFYTYISGGTDALLQKAEVVFFSSKTHTVDHGHKWRQMCNYTLSVEYTCKYWATHKFMTNIMISVISWYSMLVFFMLALMQCTTTMSEIFFFPVEALYWMRSLTLEGKGLRPIFLRPKAYLSKAYLRFIARTVCKVFKAMFLHMTARLGLV